MFLASTLHAANTGKRDLYKKSTRIYSVARICHKKYDPLLDVGGGATWTTQRTEEKTMVSAQWERWRGHSLWSVLVVTGTICSRKKGIRTRITSADEIPVRASKHKPGVQVWSASKKISQSPGITASRYHRHCLGCKISTKDARKLANNKTGMFHFKHQTLSNQERSVSNMLTLMY